MRNSINATATSARKMAIDRIGTETGLGKKFVRDKTRVKGTTQKEMNAEVLATTKRPKLSEYEHSITYSGTRGSVYADVSMSRGKQLVSNKTFANPAYGQIWRRKGPKARPFYAPTGPSVSHHWDQIKDEIKEQANAELVRLFKDKLEKQIAKR